MGFPWQLRVATNAAVLEFLEPGFGFGAIGNQVVQRAVVIVGTAGANLHGFQTERADLIEHGLQREMLVDGVENANGNLPQIAGRPGFWTAPRS